MIMRTMRIMMIYQEYKDDQIFQGDLQGLAWEVDFWSSKCKTSGLHTGSPLWLADCLQEERVSFMIISSIHRHHEQDKKIYGWYKNCNAQCAFSVVWWPCSQNGPVSDTIRRRGGYWGMFKGEGVDTGPYFRRNHGSRVWNSWFPHESCFPSNRTSRDKYMLNN